MNAVARLAIALLGLFWLVRGAATCAENSTHALRLRPLRENPDWLRDWFLSSALSGSTVLLFAVVPAVLLIALRGRLSDRLFPEPQVGASLSASTVYVLGCGLMAIFFIVQGAGGLAGGLAMMVGFAVAERDGVSSLMLSNGLAAVVGCIVQLIGGLILYRHASSQRSRTSGHAA